VSRAVWSSPVGARRQISVRRHRTQGAVVQAFSCRAYVDRRKRLAGVGAARLAGAGSGSRAGSVKP